MSQQTANVATGQNAQSCRLLRVPAEILDRIIWHLTTTELCNLRITCKHIEEALYFRFTAEFFTRKQFMISEFSLKALIDISKSRLAGSLRHVHFGLDQINVADSPLWNGAEVTHVFQQRLVEQDTLWWLGLVPKYLTEAFASLPNLESVVVRDFNSTRRSRDGPHAHWLSYGNQTMYNETTVRPRAQEVLHWTPLQHGYAGRLFKAVIHSLAMANASLTTIEVMERQGNPLFDSAFHVHPEFEAAFIPVLKGLKRLHLSLELPVSAPFRGQEERPYHRFNITKFLRHCDGLEELRINGKHLTRNNDSRSSLSPLFNWLAAPEPTPETEAQVESSSTSSRGETNGLSLLHVTAKFPQLENISLGMTAITVDDLVRFIAKFAGTLRHLELWRIQLLSGEAGDDNTLVDNKVNLCVRLLKKLLSVPNLNLRHIKLGNMQHQWLLTGYDTRIQDISFKPTAKTPDEDVTSTTKMLEYTGTDWIHFVAHEMIPRLYAPKLYGCKYFGQSGHAIAFSDHATRSPGRNGRRRGRRRR
ncbi:hypothetical protein V8C42DRAFT_322783 [Trichoderma barbatum]